MHARMFLIRHAETEWSLAGRHTGRTDVALTAGGEAAAREIGDRLRTIPFARVLTSPLQRAQSTCALAALATECEVEPDLTEWDYGEYEGLRSEEILRTRPGWNLFRDGCPGGDRSVLVSARADRLIARLRTLQGNIALFTHGHFGRVLGVRWLGLPAIAARRFLLSPGSLSVLGYEHDRSEQPAIILWNAPLHRRPDAGPDQRAVDLFAVSPRALERWENEGGVGPEPGAPSAPGR